MSAHWSQGPDEGREERAGPFASETPRRTLFWCVSDLNHPLPPLLVLDLEGWGGTTSEFQTELLILLSFYISNCLRCNMIVSAK